MPYLRNIWYVAGHSKEALATPIARVFLSSPVLIYRAGDGGVVAMDDRCPHRMAPLHRGKVVDDTIQCAYHGLRFDRTGACVHMPAGEAPPRATVRIYPIVERHSLLWIWMGDHALADPALIPDFSDCGDPAIGWYTGVLHCNANYQLLVDNLLDLTHSEFLHPFLSSNGWAKRNRQTVSQDGDTIDVLNIADQDNVLPVMLHFNPSLGPTGTTIQNERWYTPSLVKLSVTYQSGDEQIVLPSAHMLTPETEKSTHYFIRGGQLIDPGSAEMNAAMGAGVMAVFQNEDIPMIEALQRYLGDADLMEHHPAVLLSDRAATLARRHVAKRIRVEQTQVAAVAAE